MRLRLLLLVCTLPVFVFGQTMSHQERKVRRQLAKGKAYPAIRVATGALSRLNQPVFYALRAEGYNSISEFEKGQGDARTAIRLMPDSANAWLQLAIAEQGLGRMDSAAVHLRHALETQPLSEARYRLALVERARGDLDAAQAAINAGLAASGTMRQDSIRLCRAGAELAAQQGDTARSRTLFSIALALDPRDPVTYNSRGFWLWAQQGKHARAVADYDQAIKLNPNYSYAFNNRGWSEYKLGERDKGLKDIRRARKRKKRNPYIYRNLGIIALDGGDTAKACVNFRQALELGFTAQHGDEVEKLIDLHCGGTPDKPIVPVQAPQNTTDRKENAPVPRTNAP